MAVNNIMKKRIIYIIKLLKSSTDEEHTLDTGEILEYLDDEGMPTNRKTLKSDMDLLIESGFDIIVIKSKPNRYFWGEREFQIPELKMLIDAVSSSRFITKKKSRELTGKLAGIASVHQKKELDRHIYAVNRVKSGNESIYYIVDTINDAINEKKKIKFKYTDYDPEKKKIFRNNGEEYILSPYALYWNDDFYYAVGWSDKHENVSSFKVDRLYRAEIIDEKAVRKPREFNINDYSKRIFEMFGGDSVSVKLECDNELMKYVIDRFGEDVITKVASDETFMVMTDVVLSPTFYAWVFRFGGKIRIVSPKKAVKAMNRMARAVIQE
ncbi:MAG: WYL domain-containing protein [Eubacteriaceae bacterium]|nr:WYL domain-containing protein [Eubacteriaceae bacterium]